MSSILAVLSTALVLTLAAPYAQDRTAKPNDPGVETLIANERALHNAVAKADRASFVSLVLPEGVWTTTQGFIPITLLADGLDGFRITKWELVNPRVLRLGEDSALLTYVWTGTGTFNDRPLASTTLAVTVWSRRGGTWLAAHHQQTDLLKQ